MATKRSINLTLSGNPVSGLHAAIGETVDWYLTLVDPDTLAVIDLRGLNVIMALCELDIRGNPTQPPIIARQADNLGQFGTCHVPWASGDTAVNPWLVAHAYALNDRVINGGNIYVCTTGGQSAASGGPTGFGTGIVDGTCTWSFLLPAVIPGNKGIDVWITDGAGNRLQSWTFSGFKLTPAGTLPSTLITPLAQQEPLAQGPPGPAPSVPSPTGNFVVVIHNNVLRSQQEEQIKVHFDGTLGQINVRLSDYGVNFQTRPYYFAGYMVQTDGETVPIQVRATPPGPPYDFTLVAPDGFVGDVMMTLREVLS